MKGPVCSVALLAYVVGGCSSAAVPPPQQPAPAGAAPADAVVPNASDAEAGRDESAEGEAVAKHFLGDRQGGAWKASAYAWLTVGKLYWVMGPLDPTRLVAVPGEGQTPVVLTGDLSALKSFLALQFNGRLPGVDALNGVAQLVKDAIVGKRGSIAGVRTSLARNEWTLEFNVIDGAGAVDVVRAAGTASPLTLVHVSVGVLKPRGDSPRAGGLEPLRVGLADQPFKRRRIARLRPRYGMPSQPSWQ
jgi:hypothetical protein